MVSSLKWFLLPVNLNCVDTHIACYILVLAQVFNNGEVSEKETNKVAPVLAGAQGWGDFKQSCPKLWCTLLRETGLLYAALACSSCFPPLI
jgi:hypothetical protein